MSRFSCCHTFGRALLLGSLLLAILPGATPAQVSPATGSVLVVPRLTGPITLDGHVDEPAWDVVAPLSLVTHWPTFGAAPSERTEIRVAYDDGYIYVSCRCYAPPEAIFAASFQRDLNTLATDFLALGLDTYDDNASGVDFITSPTGSRSDGTMAGDTGEIDDTWNTFWDAEVTVTPEGWFSEMRIPFSSLRFQAVNGRVVMGLNVWRYLGKKNEMDLFPAIPPTWGFWSFNKSSQFQKVVFEDVETKRPIYVTPYALGGIGQSFDLNPDGTAYVRTDDPVTEFGGDVKLGIGDNLALDLTVNTDFAQVEADNVQVNLTRFSLFFPEKRQFFLERASLFNFDLGGSNVLFYSRRIGLQDGEAVRLLGGGRAVGRFGAWDVGLIDMQTARRPSDLSGQPVLPSENVGVVRLRRRVFNDFSTVGSLVTSRRGDDGTYNVALGFDSDVRLAENAYAELRWVQTFDNAIDGASPLTRARLRATVSSRAYTGFGYSAKIERAGRDYRPDLGFEQRSDFTVSGAKLWHGWRPERGSRLARHQVVVGSETFWRNADRTIETIESSASWEGALASGASLNGQVDLTHDDLREAFSLSDHVEVLPGAYTFIAAAASYDTPGGQPLRASVSAGGGAFYNGQRLTLGAKPTWVVSKYLTLSGSYEFNHIRFPDQAESFTAHVARLRIRAALNTRWSLSSLLQTNSAATAGLVNLRLRYNPREGSDFYLVIDQGFHTDRLADLPGRPFTSRRSLLAKYTYTFAL